MKFSRSILTLFTAALLGGSLAHCNAFDGDDGLPLISTLINSRMVVILKGTYATDAPLNFNQINGDTIFRDSDDAIGNIGDPVTTGCLPFADPACMPRYSQLPIYIDIGEIRLSSRNPLDEDLTQVQNQEQSEEFWDVVSTERQVYCSQLYSIDFGEDACFQTGGLINFQEFMNGRGAVYPSRDIGSEVYLHAGVFVRAFATGWGFVNGALAEDRFDNRDIIGSNVIPLLNYDPNEDEVIQSLIAPDWFPLHHTIQLGQEPTLYKDFANNALVLEIRSNIKENMMLHSFQNANDETQSVVTMSDWRRNHDDSFDDRGINMGGSVLTRARMFYPAVTNTMIIDGGVESTRHYYAVYITNEQDQGDQLPYAATPVRSGSNNSLANLMPLPYTVQCRYDCRHDGYPEVVLSSSETIFTNNGPGVVYINLPCGCGIDPPAGCDADPGCY